MKKKDMIKCVLRAICCSFFFAIFYSFKGTDYQLPIVGALIITAVYFDAEKWKLK